jgi:hypothetical protein
MKAKKRRLPKPLPTRHRALPLDDYTLPMISGLLDCEVHAIGSFWAEENYEMAEFIARNVLKLMPIVIAYRREVEEFRKKETKPKK